MRVLNKRTDVIPPEAVYVGRPTKWGNPFILGRDGTREEVIKKFEMWADNFGEEMWAALADLRGKDLVCWCAPLPCHADVLLRLANEVS